MPHRSKIATHFGHSATGPSLLLALNFGTHCRLISDDSWQFNSVQKGICKKFSQQFWTLLWIHFIIITYRPTYHITIILPIIYTQFRWSWYSPNMNLVLLFRNLVLWGAKIWILLFNFLDKQTVTFDDPAKEIFLWCVLMHMREMAMSSGMLEG